MFDVLAAAAALSPAFSKRDAYVCLDTMVDKLSDSKLKQPASAALSRFAETVGPQFIASQVRHSVHVGALPFQDAPAAPGRGRLVFHLQKR